MSKKKKKRSKAVYHVEFVGLPTSGKTTLYRTIRDRDDLLSDREVVPLIQRRKLKKIRLCLLIPYLLVRHIRSFIFITSFYIRYLSLNTFNLRVFKITIKLFLLTKYRKLDTDMVFVADGVLHMLIAVQYKKITKIEDVMREFVQWYEKRYTAIVYMDLTKEEFITRFTQRHQDKPNPILSKMTDSEKTALMERMYAQHKILLRVIQNKAETPVQVIDGEKPLQENAETVARFIEKHVG